jgi:hypothetical protein
MWIVVRRHELFCFYIIQKYKQVNVRRQKFRRIEKVKNTAAGGGRRKKYGGFSAQAKKFGGGGVRRS